MNPHPDRNRLTPVKGQAEDKRKASPTADGKSQRKQAPREQGKRRGFDGFITRRGSDNDSGDSGEITILKEPGDKKESKGDKMLAVAAKVKDGFGKMARKFNPKHDKVANRKGMELGQGEGSEEFLLGNDARRKTETKAKLNMDNVFRGYI
jgi:hypothetical protein